MKALKYLTNRKYRMFSRKLRDVQNSIWEFEFKVAKSRQVREGVRLDRDRMIETHNKIKISLENIGEDKKQKEKLVKESEIASDNVKRYEAQMKMIDDQIEGVPPKDNDPGQQGILDTIKSLVELKNMYRDYLNKL